jgi:cell pole-organizing protein PopZ
LLGDAGGNMAEKQTEMSLDEMLSSIKQMVIDKDPPVLELTDMVSPDGTIIKVGNGQSDCSVKNEMRDFLRLAQEETDTSLSKGLTPNLVSTETSGATEKKSLPCETKENPSKKMGITVSDVVREIATPIIEQWLEKNLRNIVKEIVAAEVQKMVGQN